MMFAANQKLFSAIVARYVLPALYPLMPFSCYENTQAKDMSLGFVFVLVFGFGLGFFMAMLTLAYLLNTFWQQRVLCHKALTLFQSSRSYTKQFSPIPSSGELLLLEAALLC